MFSPVADNLETPVIMLPVEQPLLNKLQRKLKEYKSRLLDEQMRNPYYPPEEFASWYAVRILGQLLEEGQINTWDLARQIERAHGGAIRRLDHFERYCAVINDYATTGGSKAQGGTGLNDVTDINISSRNITSIG